MFRHAGTTIFLGLAGSHAQGIARESSDLDLRGVCVVPLAERLSLFETFAQYEGGVPVELAPQVVAHLQQRRFPSGVNPDRAECVIFDVAKFLRLCSVANPGALELLFTDREDWIVAEEPWERLHAARQRFLTRKVGQTFVAYGRAQLKRIVMHRAWLTQPPAHAPRREDYGLPASSGTLNRSERAELERALDARLEHDRMRDLDMPEATRVQLEERLAALWRRLTREPGAEAVERHQIEEAARSLGIPRTTAKLLAGERRYRAALRNWDSYQRWVRERNPERAELERRFGYDTKHAMHLVRVMTMGVEALTQGTLRVRVSDAQLLRDVRAGELSFDTLVAHAAALEAAAETALGATTLPADIDLREVDALARSIMWPPSGAGT